MTERLRQLLPLLEQQWVRLNAPIARSLNPGADGATLDRVEAELSFTLPPEVRALYRWHNGVPRERLRTLNGATSIIGPGHLDFMPVETALEQYRLELSLNQEDLPNWSTSWFPLFVLDATRVYAHCDLATPAGTPVGVVHKEWDEAEKRRTESLADLIAFWLEVLSADTYCWSPGAGWPELTRPYIDLPLAWRTSGLPV